jgi:hypothetical protein
MCYTGYYLDKISGLCIRNDPMCKTNDGNGSCLSCLAGYVLVEKICQHLPIYSQYYYA